MIEISREKTARDGGITLGENLADVAAENNEQEKPGDDPQVFVTTATGAGTSGGFGSFQPFGKPEDPVLLVASEATVSAKSRELGAAGDSRVIPDPLVKLDATG